MLRKFYLSWYPREIAGDSRKRNIANRIILIGIGIRFLAMPFTAHNDFLSEHIRVYQIVDGTNLFPGILQIATHYLDALYMMAAKFMIPGIAAVFAPDKGGLTTAGIERFMEFCGGDYILRTIFVFKIPYLIAELAAVFLILKLAENNIPGKNKNMLPALRFLMYNPATIYAVYIFGRFEVYVFLFIVLSLYFAKNKNIYWAGLFFGLSIITRAYPVFLLPIFLILLPEKIKGKIIFLVFSFVPLLVAVISFKIYNLIMLSKGMAVNTVTGVFSRESSFINTVFRSVIQIGDYGIQLFTLAYILLLIFILNYCRRMETGKITHTGIPEDTRTTGGEAIGLFLVRVSYFSVTFFMLFYLLINYSAHWITWFVPFGTLLVFKNKKYFSLFYILIGTWFFHWLFNTDVGVFTPYLLSPVGGGYFHQAAQIIGQKLQRFAVGDYLNLQVLIVLFRTIFSAAIIWIIVNIGMDLRNNTTKSLKTDV